MCLNKRCSFTHTVVWDSEVGIIHRETLASCGKGIKISTYQQMLSLLSSNWDLSISKPNWKQTSSVTFEAKAQTVGDDFTNPYLRILSYDMFYTDNISHKTKYDVQKSIFIHISRLQLQQDCKQNPYRIANKTHTLLSTLDPSTNS